MNSLLLSLSLLSIHPQVRVAQSDSWFGADKVKHFFIAAFVETVTFSALESFRIHRSPAMTAAIAMTGIVSVGREVHDKRAKNQFSFEDLTWDALGAAGGYCIVKHAQNPK